MKIFILRHGDTQNATAGEKDFDRKLSEAGVLEAIKVGDYLKDLEINQIICSSAIRAVETQAIVNEFIKTDNVAFFDDLYLAPSQTILNTVNRHGLEQNLLYVGHNFGISDFASYLSGKEILMSTCMLVELNVQIEEWGFLSSNTGVLTSITEPNQL